MVRYIGILAVAFTIIIQGCNKEEGLGGLSSISGVLIKKEMNKYNSVINVYPADKEDVYIIYGNDEMYGDDVETSYNGYFSFEYLTAGNYTIWYYTDDTLEYRSSRIAVIEIPVSISDREDKKLDTLYTFEYIDYNDGNSSISGQVYLVNYWNSALQPYDDFDIKDVTPAQDYEVYLIYEYDTVYCERVRTNYNGYYRFEDLITGNYRVYVYSDDLPGGIHDAGDEGVISNPESFGTFDLVLYSDTAINSSNQNIILEDFYVEQE
ncbi:MAG: hypothetical protein JW894_04055 [Bacteroidales bacterium]|nr:hypothetical protein [Bacteroidales bacterium]